MGSIEREIAPQDNEVAAIVVCYNSALVIREFLSAIPAHTRIIVVDNASQDRWLPPDSPAVTIISLESNIGYGAACNVGAAATDAPFLLFANPDIKIESGTIDALLKAAAQFPDAAFNPLIYSKGRPKVRMWSRLLPDTQHSRGPVPNSDSIVPVLSGACLFVRREHFDRIGGFDPEIFLFHEDDDVSLRLRQAGIELRIAAGAVIHHDEGNSSSRSLHSERIKGEAMGRSLVYVMKKHGVPLDVMKERRKAMVKLLLPYVLFSPARRTKLLGFLRGMRDGV